MRKNNLTLEEIKEKLKRKYLRGTVLMKLGIYYKILEGEKPLMIIPHKNGIAAVYVSKTLPTSDYRFTSLDELNNITEEELNLIENQYMKKKEEVDFLEEVLKSQRLRRIFKS